jgi:hypothetical protein
MATRADVCLQRLPRELVHAPETLGLLPWAEKYLYLSREFTLADHVAPTPWMRAPMEGYDDPKVTGTATASQAKTDSCAAAYAAPATFDAEEMKLPLPGTTDEQNLDHTIVPRITAPALVELCFELTATGALAHALWDASMAWSLNFSGRSIRKLPISFCCSNMCIGATIASS